MTEKNKAVKNVIWRSLEKFGSQGVSLLVSIVLARILDPSYYTTIAVTSIYLSIINVFVDGGFGSALIQKKDATEEDFSTVFYFNIALCIFMYILMFMLAPTIGRMYNDDLLVSVIRVQSLLILISSVKNVQKAYISRKMMFKKFFFATLLGTIGAAVLGVWMALAGFGVWALVAQSLFNNLVDTIVLWISVKWRPKFCFSIDSLKELFGFGWKLFAVNLLNVIYANLRQMIVGLKFSSLDLVYYNKGETLTRRAISDTVSSVEDVAFPLASSHQDDKERLKQITRRVIRISTFICFPVLLGIASVADNLISVVYTSKWLGCVPYLRIFCLTYLFYPIHVLSLNTIKSAGRSDVYLNLEIIKKVSEVLLIAVAMQFNSYILAFSSLVFIVATLPLDLAPNKKIIGYSISECFSDFLPNLAIASVMAGVVYVIGFVKLSTLPLLICQIMTGVVVYIILAYIFQRSSFDYVMDVIVRKRR